MDKSAIRNFAIEARKILMKSAITEAGFYGITKEGCKYPIQKGQDFEVYETLAGTENRIFGSDIKRRENLVHAIEEVGFDQVIEETAYTWFNRIIAIRFMEVNDYLPTRVRVLSSETGSNTPDIVTQSLDVDLNMTPEELEKVQQAKDNNKYDEAFRLLFIKQCNELNKILPGLFEKTDDYMELLLKLSYTGDGVVRMLVDTVPEDSFNVETEGQVEIIGWMYQYYNTELKDDTFDLLKKNVKVNKERIPAATQLFTPDWIVKYMVQNSLGRLWIEHLKENNPELQEKSIAKQFGWDFYLSEEQADLDKIILTTKKDVKELSPEDIQCIDPSMGSGHVLVYMFDIFMEIYQSEGYQERDAVFFILKNNLFGLDIDKRAYQLSYFALTMKARQINRRYFKGCTSEDGHEMIYPNVMEIEESNSVCRNHIKFMGKNLEEKERNTAYSQLEKLIEDFNDAKEYGTITIENKFDYNLLIKLVDDFSDVGQISFETIGIEETRKKLKNIINQSKLMSTKYHVVTTNPPYLGNKSMSPKMSQYLKKHYDSYKMDLFAVFVKRCIDMTRENGKLGFMTPFVWMFITSFADLREYIISHSYISSLVQLEYSGFDGATVPICTFTLSKTDEDKFGEFVKLSSFKGVDQQEPKTIEAVKNEKCGYRYSVKSSTFRMFPETVIAYWASKTFYNLFSDNKSLDSYFPCKKGMTTGDNNAFLRLWYEVDKNLLTTRYKYYAKGGGFRRWYGNGDYVVDWIDNGKRLREFKGATLRNEAYYFKKAITWGLITSNLFSARAINAEYAIGDAGPVCISSDEEYLYVLGLLNSIVATYIMDFLNPTLNFSSGVVGSIPYIPIRNVDTETKERIEYLVNENICISKSDWDSFENSWDFKRNPLIPCNLDKDNILIEDEYDRWKSECNERFKTLKDNEEELNRIYSRIYGLDEELTYVVDEKNVGVKTADFEREISNLISYAVGCMFGRYSLDEDGIIFAGGAWDDSKYKTIIPDVDGIIPITDADYFEDDIVNKFVEFIEKVYGSKTLEINLEYIASGINVQGNTSREKIRNYFLNEFFKNHCNAYSVNGSGKRPIYWLFDSGKQNGFKVLIYVHRYNKDMIGLIRSDYLRKMQESLERALQNVDYIISSTSSATEKARSVKKKDKYLKQLAESKAYYQALSHVALQRKEIDLNDGIKTNYAIFQKIIVSEEGTKKQTIDLLAKI